VPGFTNAYAKPDGVFGAAQELLPERKGSGGIEIQEADLSQCAGARDTPWVNLDERVKEC
jgi:hypothetical protein